MTFNVADLPPIVVPFARFSPEVVEGGLVFGIRQSVSDAAALDVDKTTGLSGSVISLNGPLCGRFKGSGLPQTGRTMAHELGHYLGLFHKNGKPGNLMCQTGKASNSCTSIQLIDHQKRNISNHCAMKPGC
jgi:hypothetical protein